MCLCACIVFVNVFICMCDACLYVCLCVWDVFVCMCVMCVFMCVWYVFVCDVWNWMMCVIVWCVFVCVCMWCVCLCLWCVCWCMCSCVCVDVCDVCWYVVCVCLQEQIHTKTLVWSSGRWPTELSVSLPPHSLQGSNSVMRLGNKARAPLSYHASPPRTS